MAYASEFFCAKSKGVCVIKGRLEVKSSVLQKTLSNCWRCYRSLLTYCALNGVAPDYLSELFTYRHVNRTLRSASQPPLLSIPASQTVTHGDHRFAVCSAVLWNNLPSLLRTATTVNSFKTLLKTHLFRQAFL